MQRRDNNDRNRVGGSNTVTLIPRPSSNPQDPLNWSRRRKNALIGTLAFASFVSDGAPPANLLAYNIQALTYHKTPTEVAYGTSASLAGYLIGPWLYPWLFQVVGTSAVVFWGLILQILTQVWGALMTGQDDYIGYVISRLFCGALASIPFAAGSAVIMDTFFLHQRGRMFALLELSFISGVFVIPSLGGFMLRDSSLNWSWCFWWTTFLLILTSALVFVFLDETRWNQNSSSNESVPAHQTFLEKRYKLFFRLRDKRLIASSRSSWLQQQIIPLKIMTAPNVIVVETYNMVAFGFATISGILVNVYLQTPVEAGGYGFTPEENAYFSFTSWGAIAFGFLYGCIIGDWIPVRFSRKRGGLWRPEYRLLNLILPGFLLPVGLGLFGATLEQENAYHTRLIQTANRCRLHMHYLLLALALFLIQFSAQIGIPICINYAAENFVNHPVAVVVAMNTLRIPFAIALPFAAAPWLATVGPGWLFGTAALLCFGMFIMVMTVGIGLGKKLRMRGFFKDIRSNEDGMVIFESERGS